MLINFSVTFIIFFELCFYLERKTIPIFKRKIEGEMKRGDRVKVWVVNPSFKCKRKMAVEGRGKGKGTLNTQKFNNS